MRSGIIILAFCLLGSFKAYSQFVGDGAATPPPATTPGNFLFTMKFGLAMPSGNMAIAPSDGITPKYSEGYLGAKNGFFAEFGMGMELGKPESKIAFYYYPVLGAFWKTNLDWSENNDATFDQDEIYIKSLRAIEVAQRYGISFKPVEKMSVALYYRPGLLIPLKFEIASEEDFQFMGEMSTNKEAPIFILSHAPGLSIQYSTFSLSFEKYFVRPTYDITFNPTGPEGATKVMSKIPMKMSILSLALHF